MGVYVSPSQVTRTKSKLKSNTSCSTLRRRFAMLWILHAQWSWQEAPCPQSVDYSRFFQSFLTPFCRYRMLLLNYFRTCHLPDCRFFPVATSFLPPICRLLSWVK